MENWTAFLVDFGRSYGLKIVAAIAILIIGRIAAGIIKRIVIKILK